MNKEYTLLALGSLVVLLPWIGLTASLLRVLLTILGLVIIYIAYRYWVRKNPK